MFPTIYRSNLLEGLYLDGNNFDEEMPHFSPISSSDWNGTLPALSVLLLKANHFHGEFPIHLCNLYSLSIVDLCQNKLSGPIPSCLGNLTLMPAMIEKSDIRPSTLGFGSFNKELADLGLKIYDLISNKDKNSEKGFPAPNLYLLSYADEEIEFSTKSASYSYKGNILDHISIPPQLTELTTLAVFTVAYNNLSGRLPDRKAQFGTFDESSYVGNPLLCGLPIKNSCAEGDSPGTPSASSGEEEHGFIDKDVFAISFAVSYAIILLGIAIVLYINPYWRRAWFYSAEERSTACYYFIVDSLHRLPCFRRNI
ncbi:hypothetical protein REPUB_Repub15cG0125000 [Reevesia pubescens]